GVQVHFITAVGDDDFGKMLERELESFGVSTEGVRQAIGVLTPVSFCSVDHGGGKTFSFYRFPGWSSPMQTLEATDFAAATRGRIFDFSEAAIRDPVIRPLVFQAARDARAAGVPVIYAVNLRRDSWRKTDPEIMSIQREAVKLADIVVLNAEEVNYIGGAYNVEGMRKLQSLGPRAVVMTHGGEGDVLVLLDDEQAAIPPEKVTVVYDVGAGDVFHAGLVAELLQRDVNSLTLENLTAAVRFATAAAAIRVSSEPDPHNLPTREQVEEWMRGR
ncbi:MAG: PfkB family carbohydrate kinase, partial [bacterium]